MKQRCRGTWGIAMIVALFFMAAGICLPGNRVHAYDIEYARNGVVPVVFVVKDPQWVVYDTNSGKIVDNLDAMSGELEIGNGSGFFIGKEGENPQYLVTNQHVIQEYVDAGEGGTYLYPYAYYEPDTYGNRYWRCIYAASCEMRVYYSESEWETAYVDATGDVSKVDLAILKLRQPTEKRHALILEIPTQEMVGTTKVSTIGYPGNADNGFTSASKYGVNDSTVHNGTINRLVADSKGVERIAMDATIQHGNSGGPLVTEDGYVIGVNTNVESNSPYSEQIEADYYAISTGELVRFLDKNSVSYQMASDAADAAPANEDNAPADESGGENIGAPAVEESPAAEDKAGNMPLLLIGVIVAVLAAAAVVVALLYGKKKAKGGAAQTVAEPQSAPAPQPVPQKKALLRSLSVQHNGMTYAVHSTPLMIGRDPATCKVVFKEGTEGVSGRHCSVSFDEASGEFVLTDLRSTYGTFLANGQKLSANVPYRLKAGDGFYAGDKANSFRVELG